MFSKLLSLLFLTRRKPAKSRRRAPSRLSIHGSPNGPNTRTPLRERDKTLAPETRVWLKALPPAARPVELAARFPRICNHIALVWTEQLLIEDYFSNLLVDNRGGKRTGFPPGIANELIRLHVFFINTMSSPHAVKAWDDRMLAVGDR